MFKLQNISFSFPEQEIFRECSVSVSDDGVTALIGKSGSGKTTLLHILGLLHYSYDNFKIKGEIVYQSRGNSTDSQSLSLLSVKDELWKIRRKITYISQEPSVFEMSILDNLFFPVRLQGGKKDKSFLKEAVDVLGKVHLFDEVKERLDNPAANLSVGQKQRLCIARALMLKPEVLLLDEPTSALDPESAEGINILMRELSGSQKIIFASHQMDQVRSAADEILECRDLCLKEIIPGK